MMSWPCPATMSTRRPEPLPAGPHPAPRPPGRRTTCRRVAPSAVKDPRAAAGPAAAHSEAGHASPASSTAPAPATVDAEQAPDGRAATPRLGAPGAMLAIISGPSGVGKDTIIEALSQASSAVDVPLRGHVHHPGAQGR